MSQRVGLDLANGFIKVALENGTNLVYENRLTQLTGLEFDALDVNNETVYEVNGERYILSKTGISSGGRSSDRYFSPQYLIECLIALSQVVTEQDVVLCVGLPCRDYLIPGLRDRMRDMLIGSYEVKINGKPKIIHIEHVEVTCEPLGSLLNVIYDSECRPVGDRNDYSYLVIDIGFGTTDILGTKDGIRPVKLDYADVGIMDALNHYLTLINQRMADDGNAGRFAADDVTLMLQTDVRKYGRSFDFSPELVRAKQYAAKLIEAKINQSGVNLNDYDRVLFTGGGAVALREHLTIPHNARINPRAQIGNAQGYVKFLQLKGV